MILGDIQYSTFQSTRRQKKKKKGQHKWKY